MSIADFDVLIIGGGIAGASLGALLAPHRRIAIIEREMQPGYHSTGRSAALLLPSYGGPAIRALTHASRRFFAAPPEHFCEHRLMRPRGALYIARREQRDALDALAAALDGEACRMSGAAARAMCPILRADYVDSALHESECHDLDVHEIHRGFLRWFKRAGGRLELNADVRALERTADRWAVYTSEGCYRAPIVVNAAGAWADEIAKLAGVRPLDIRPLRRTALTIESPAGLEVESWPVVVDVDDELYFKPDAGRLLLSPADETPWSACDVQPNEMDVALAVDRFEHATAQQVRRVLSSWAGLRSFAPDRNPVVGFDREAPGFFWLAGQGGYGIQTAPAIARLASALMLDHPLDEQILAKGIDAEDLSPTRFA